MRTDPTGFVIWQLCDGTRDLSALRDELSSVLEGDVDPHELEETVSSLIAGGFLRRAPVVDSPIPAASPVKVAFLDPSETFDPLDNYWTWMMSGTMDVVVVDDETLADVTFHWDSTGGLQDERHRPVKAQIVSPGGRPDLDNFDYAFGTDALRHTRTHGSQRYGRVPRQLRDATGSVAASYEDKLTPGYRAARISNRFHRYLFDDSPRQPSAAPRPRLTIGMATYDDYDGVFFSVEAIRLYHPEVTGISEILIIDNHPEGPESEYLRRLERQVAGVRYVPYSAVRGTSVRDMVFREARGEYVLCMDSHVFLEAGSISRLVDYLDARPECMDLLQGPLLGEKLDVYASQFDPVWRAGMYGTWGLDDRARDRDSEPFEIPMQGLGVFACRKDAWLGFNPKFRGFGAEEGYIHEKFRQAGRRTLCLPFLRWVHRFGRPAGTRYANLWKERIRNYLIGFEELGMDTEAVTAHFREHVSESVVTDTVRALARERNNPFDFFGAIYCINLDGATGRWREVVKRFERLDIAERVMRFGAVETPESHHTGCALSHRACIAEAKKLDLDSVLVFEDDVLFVRGELYHLGQCLPELAGLEWNVLYLGGHRWGETFDAVDDREHLRRIGPGQMTSTHAVAYHRRVFDMLLDAIPAGEFEVEQWLHENGGGIDQYLRKVPGRFVCHPVIASQQSILGQEDESLRDLFW